MWYYSLAHRPAKVCDVMNLLMAYSLVQSAAYPPAAELDDHLARLLRQRSTTLEALAAQDLEAAELLGKMLSGYASLRQFYELRDGAAQDQDGGGQPPPSPPPQQKQQAAQALVSVIAAADDKIRGGLYDATRDGIVSEDFLLALLGEALAFVADGENSSAAALFRAPPRRYDDDAAPLTLAHIDALLKAVEDLQAVGPRVYTAAEEFLQLVLASAPGGVVAAGGPADLMRRSAAGAGAQHYVMSGSSVMAGRLRKSLAGGKGTAAAGQAKGRADPLQRAWDWRARMGPGTKGKDVVRKVRLGLAKDLAGLWLAEADGMMW